MSVRSGSGPSLHHLEAGAGDDLVLVHGGTGGGANWFRIIPLLSPHYHVLAPDLPGFGLSERAPPVAPMSVNAADALVRWRDGQGCRRVQPTTVMSGGRDRLLPIAHAHHAAAHLPSARLHVLPFAGHSPNWEAPEEVAAAIRARAS